MSSVEVDLVASLYDKAAKSLGIEKVDPKGYRITSKWNPRTLPNFKFKKFWKKYRGKLTFYFSGQIIPQTRPIPLFSIYHRRKRLPYFEALIDFQKGKVILRYQGVTSFQRSFVSFDSSLKSISGAIIQIKNNVVTIQLDCHPSKSVKLRQKIAPIPRSSKIGLQDFKSKEKIIGLLFEAKVYSYINNIPSTCFSKALSTYQRDAGKISPQTTTEELRALQRRLSHLTSVVNTLQSENTELKARLSLLDTCVCYPQCLVNGVIYADGESWQKDTCTFCTCREGQEDCIRRVELPQCHAPCATSPCQNNGYCVDASPDPSGYHCMCQPPYDGPLCETRQNPCVWPQEPGLCNMTVVRYYYDRFEEECLPFNFTGCGGNVNNYESFEACREVAMTGACCFRRFKADEKALISGNQMKESKCRVMSLKDCKSIHNQKRKHYTKEVVAFYPSLSCEEAGCMNTQSGCVYDGTSYQPGAITYQGCQKCTCEIDERWTCQCDSVSKRKDIRDMTTAEISRFQVAIQQLRQKDNQWEKLRDMYMAHGMHANGGPYFLPWHRVFLREVEKKLQKIDCGITLPYFDFTTDVGNFAEAIIWQPNYFGGDGSGLSHCLTDHSFGSSGSWQPCIMRNFHTTIQLPTMAELALALASDDYTEMSMCLESYISYVHLYIGGDMATTGGPYDPVFFAIHSFIDMLYWRWQQRGNNKFKYPAAFGNIPMVPFNIPPSSVLDLEADLCVTYAPPSLGHPCNATTDIPGGDRGDTPSSKVAVVNYPGYVGGFDRNGYDLYGYKKNGLNRDGYDKDGYDLDGYNRYGYNKEGYNRWGFNRTGFDRGGKRDTQGIYDQYGFDDQCLNIQGLTKYGFDRFGFTPDGYDKDDCNFLFTGPFDVLHSLKIWELLSLQDKGFLMSVYRLCPTLDPVPLSWSKQFWASRFKDVSGLVPSITPETSLSIPSSRFCFETTPYLTPCTCETSITSCTENPCLTDVCPSYPEAICHVDFCSECKSTWYYNNQQVDCLEDRDFCDPNPCLNGGTCQKSIWPTEPQLVTCICPPGFDGPLCQYTAIEVCSLPLSTGNCNERQSRWFYNHQTQNCEPFIYSGCGGNSNHFLTEEACQSRCVIGACCHRKPMFRNRIVGYNLDNYDRYGFDTSGNSRRGTTRNLNNTTPFGMERYNSKGFDWEGYDVFGYDKEGYDRLGFNSEGYDREGFNIQGYNKIGEYDGILEYDKEGYNVEGFNRAGMNCYGYNRRGLDYYGMSTGYDYKCRPMSLIQCQNLEQNSDIEVVQFQPGKRCSEVSCGEKCGCTYRNNTYSFGDEFRLGCQTCSCTIRGTIQCQCMRRNFMRKEIRDLTKEELELYQLGIKRLATSTGHEPSLWYQFAEMYQKHKPQAVGSDQFLPWHRAFLKYIEQHLHNINCDIAIPYYDWTIDAGEPHKSVIWSTVVFGGNGEGQSGCVPYHNFKDYYPPYWVPCLRRQFNNSVTFPDAINVQLAMNDPSYTNFRLQMEIMLAAVQSYVGGHMYSDMSPYDPVFLSIVAYIDKLWTLWQKKHPDWTGSYPVKLRYKPMEPFKLTPDDVIYSHIQMCVDYIPLTFTTLCNITLPRYGYDAEGFDRHGLDREGYDKDGFNIDGFDRNGTKDSRGIFNIHGYDRGGFNRQGFDVTGFDRYGFYIDMYNLDGFDSKGYDRWGYDRYGFDINGVTPYGFNRNGTWNPNADKTAINKFGYNIFGFNKYGYDREGYDVFGFDSRGLDRYFCNNFYLGPVYMVIKRWVELELEKLDKTPILDIYRLCPYVTFMPSWMYTVNWLNRGDQVIIIKRLEKQLREDHRYDPTFIPRSSSVTEHNVWLPVPPDQRLCFVTNYFSGCPFGQFPVTCRPDLCRQRRCPGIPDAVCRINTCGDCSIEWYNGITGAPVVCSGCVTEDGREEPEGATWRKSECDVCSCQDGMVQCSTTLCPAVTCRNPVQIPGQCCASCEGGCQFEGRIYEPGVMFSPDTSPCSECVCNRGDVSCRQRPCPALGKCKSSMTLPGDCCPTCMDCGNYANASMWMQGPCQKCSCINREVKCSEIQCGIPDCRYPYTPPGECCPTCVSCYYNGRRYEDGSRFDLDACTRCVCRHGDVQCSKTACPDVFCQNPITRPGECCPTCTSDCEYDMKIYSHKESFIASYDPCLNCSCMNSIVRCIPIMCPNVDFPCRNPIRKGEGCCEYVCPSCVDGGKEYYNGDTWPSPRDPCQVCQCSEGIVTCRTNKNCMYRCTHGIIPQGKCCSDCRDCLFNGRVISDGRRFQAPGDRCQQCTCERGNVRCQTSGPCPTLTCRITEQLPGECCPRCKGCIHEGQRYQNGDTISASLCESCVCNQGAVECKPISCAPPRCDNPVQVPGRCCPVCQGCEFQGMSYPEGQTFNNPRDPCEQCTCQNGQVQCRRNPNLCSPRLCTHPETKPGDCCPACDGCVFMRRRFSNGQKFVPAGGDPCKICRCMNGNVTCMSMDCPSLDCKNPVKPPGYCCGVCPLACTVRGRNYSEGQTFADPRDKCNVCTCADGLITCKPMVCPVPQCNNPTIRPGQCCPSCQMCSHGNRQLQNGESYVNPKNPCQQCTCQNGVVTCTSVRCPVLNCIDPLYELGKCCPSCPSDKCIVEGRTYRSGDVFCLPSDPCQECQCIGSKATCAKRECPETRCRHPAFLAGKCCPECQACNYNGLIYKDKEQFANPRDRCQTCTCNLGNVVCKASNCPNTQCQHPVTNRCCPECKGCFYKSRTYQNGEQFQDNRDPCVSCTCRDGNVTCVPKPCPAVSCKNPVQGRCCAECVDCMYQGRRLRNDQRFRDNNNQCNECRCRQGTVSCSPLPCPTTSCSNPTQGRCCPECRNCLVDGRVIPNNQPVPSAPGSCQQCICRNGNVECGTKRCRSVQCSHPVQRECCRECSDCLLNGREYRNGEMFPDSTDRCKECQCSNGNIQCRQKICQDVRQLCNSPAVTDCCPRCQDCQYRDQLYRDRERFPDVTDPCKECSCQKGNVNCVQKTCPATTCSHPIRDQCCPRCGSDCFYNNRMYTDKQTFRESCRTCQCDGGSVTCSDVSCPSTQCSHPVYDECCKRCDRCLFEGRIYGDGQSFQDRNDPCSACVCQSGSVTCSKKPCPDHKCSHPITTQCCPECTDCMYEGEIIRHDESKRKDECHVCTCRFGSVDCRRPECPTDICSNPYTDTCGCQRCDKCTHQGATYNNGATFPDPQDKCRRCQCLDGTVLCPKIPCRVQCTHPSASDGCCPICNDCMYENAIQRHGELFTSQLDPCQRCQCREGSVQCLKRTCRVDCSHPATTDGCCPICRDCRYEGVVQKYGSVFTSKTDPCQQCQCRDGNVNCLTIACDPVNCPRPVTRPGQCCPECQVCNFLGGVYNDGQRFTHPQDRCKTCTCFGDRVECVRPPCDTPCTYPTQGLCCPLCDNCEFEGKIRPNGATFKPDACRTCTCTNGNVKCITQSCPPLACIQQEVPEGECCPRCKSCSFSGRQYVDGSTFVLEREPCMNCLCHNTVMTCEERKCFSVCDNPVNDPNECCPVCPTCTYQGREYRDGETFSPRGDPCDICTCSEGRLKCQHTVCPRTANCPANQIIPPLPGECCPTCSGLGYNCTRADIGNVIKPRPDDACFRCECRAEKNWMCTYEPCAAVNCPASVWIKPQGQCCPTCPACHDLEVDRWYEEGTSWSGDNDPCVHCECRGGDVFCQVIGCPAVVCNREQRFVKPKGKCCAMCEDIPAVPCQYNSAVYQAGESWRVDDCTDCRCLGGVVECLTQTCPPLDCDPSDVATATPGSCCPVCITKPGTCLVFGDPHYYTFDGTTIHFQGFCKYTMATDCVNNDFVVDVHHDNRGAAGHVSWAQNFTITLGRSVIELLQNHIVEVDGRRVELPFFNKNFSVEHTQDTVLFNTKIGVKLVWNGNSYAELSVPGTYRNKLCGLCGNFNGFPMDDMKTKGRRITNSPSIFGNSWKTLQQENEFCEDGTDLDPCVEAGYRARKFATTQCSILRGPKFSRCHRAVAPDPFYAACVYDLCVCGDNSTCLCDILSSYAKECAKVGVRLEWREAGLCDFGCDDSLGFVFDECGPVCPRTCENYDTPLGDLKTNCFKPCIASCQCPADKVLLNGRCVPFDQCPRIDRGDIPVGPAQG